MNDFMELPICIELKDRDKRNNSNYYCNLREIVEKATPALEKINHVFPSYTDHGIRHSIAIAKTMGEVIGSRIHSICDLELYIMAICAVLHDFGMIVSEQEETEIIAGKYRILRYGTFEKIKKYIANGDENLAVQYLIRKSHGDRLPEAINLFFSKEDNLFCDRLKNPLKTIIVNICSSHLADSEELSRIFNNKYHLSDNIDCLYIASVLRIADLLDISASRAYERMYNILRISSEENNKNHWLKNLAVFSGEKIAVSDFSKRCCDCDHVLQQVRIQGYSFKELNSICNGITIKEYDQLQCEIIEYKANIEREIASCNRQLFMYSDKIHQLYLAETVDYSIHQDYRQPNHKIDINYNSVVELLLGETIYGDQRVGLREIIQNGIDACKYKLVSLDENDIEAYSPTIIIEFVKPEGKSDYEKVEIYDTGIGMDRKIIENYFLTIGKSLYTSDDFLVSNKSFLHAGYYGIGFFSSFMLSDNVEVFTRLLGTTDTWHVSLNRFNRYASIEKCSNVVNGTKIILDYNRFRMYFPTVDDVRFYIEANFLSDISSDKNVSIIIRDNKRKRTVSLPSLRDRLCDEQLGEKANISTYLNEIECQIAYKPLAKAKWFVLSIENDNVKFVECSVDRLKQYKTITYLKLFYDNSYLFVPPEIDENPFFYNGDRQRPFNLLTERLISKFDYTLKDFLDDNNFTYPASDKIPPAFIGKFIIHSEEGDVYFAQENISICNLEPDGGVVLVGETDNDTIYIRNVRIPNCKLKLPIYVYMANNLIMPQITRLLVNVLMEGFNPVLNRNDLKESDKKALAYAIGSAVLSHYSQLEAVPPSMPDLVKMLYDSDNPFIHK